MIYFIRHGQSEYNLKGLTQGWADNPLTEKGEEQARLSAEKLKTLKIDVIYSSPLIRARKTAEIINEFHNVPIIFDERLKERGKGSFSGTPNSNKEARKKFEENPHAYGGETNEEFFERCKECFNELKKIKKNILIVSHGGVYTVIYKVLNGMTYDQLVPHPIENAEIYICKKES